MDYLKSATVRKYTYSDLNCPHIIHIANRQKLEALYKRAARRILRQELKKEAQAYG